MRTIFDYLTWSHFKILLTVKSPEKRKEYEKILKLNKLTIRDFFLLVKNDSTDLISYDEDILSIINTGSFINQKLLDNKLAVKWWEY